MNWRKKELAIRHFTQEKGKDTVRRCSRNVCFQPSLVLRPSLAPVLFDHLQYAKRKA